MIFVGIVIGAVICAVVVGAILYFIQKDIDRMIGGWFGW